MLARTMLSGANVLILDEPTNHLDLESITALNKGMIEFTGSMLFATQDHECIQTVANRIMEILPGGLVDRRELRRLYRKRNRRAAARRASCRRKQRTAFASAEVCKASRPCSRGRFYAIFHTLKSCLGNGTRHRFYGILRQQEEGTCRGAY